MQFNKKVCLAAGIAALVTTGLISPVVANATANDEGVTLTVTKVRGPQAQKMNGVLQVNLKNDGDSPREHCVVSADDGGKLLVKRIPYLNKHLKWWWTDVSVGSWTIDASCNDGSWSLVQQDVRQISGSVQKPRVENQSWSCDDHGFLSFNVEYSNYLSTGGSAYEIRYAASVYQHKNVGGSHGKWAGIDGVLHKYGPVEVVAWDEYLKPHTWTFEQPKCNPSSLVVSRR